MAEEITRIETALAHHDKQIHDLEEVIGRQWEEIDRLKRMVEKLQGRLEGLETSVEAGDGTGSVSDMAAANKPPHY